MRLLFALFVALALAGPVAAQDTPPPDGESGAAHLDADTARRARDEYTAGVEHYQNGRYREAIRAFQVAASLTPSADLSYNIARAYEEVARREGNAADWDEAISYYRRYLSDRVDPPDRAEVEAHIVELTELADAARRAALSRPTTGTLSVRVDHDGARIRVNDEDRGTSPLTDAIELAPGRYRLAADLDGYVPYRGEVTIEAGLRTSAVVELLPGTGYVAQQGTPVFAWVSFGLAGAALIGSVVLGAIAASDQSAALTPFDMARLDAARGLAGWSDAALGGAIGFAALGVILYFAESASVGTTVTHGPGDAAEPASDGTSEEPAGAVDDGEGSASGG